MAAGWEEAAACRSLDAGLFYPAKGDPEQEARAKAVCGRCPVRESCLAATMEEEKRLNPSDRDGVRGGLNGRERYVAQHGQMPARPRRKPAGKRKAAPRPLSPCGTPAAYDRHVRRREPIDEACRTARSSRYKSPRRQLAAAPERPECGTRSGYQWHTAHHEIPCEPCTAADLAVTWFVRQSAGV
jgi:hypothetical protein